MTPIKGPYVVALGLSPRERILRNRLAASLQRSACSRALNRELKWYRLGVRPSSYRGWKGCNGQESDVVGDSEGGGGGEGEVGLRGRIEGEGGGLRL